MVRQSLSRRRFGAALTALSTAALAGCSDDETTDDDEGADDTGADNETDDSGGDDDTFELDNPGDLTIYLENEDGEPVSSGVAVTIESVEEDFTANYQNEIQNGEISGASLIYEGEYTVTAESPEDEFDTVEETVTLEEDEDEELTLVLDGAAADEDDEDDE